MITNLYTVYDTVAQCYGRPFTAQNDPIAIRSFKDITFDPNSDIARNPADYTLMHIGQFDDELGMCITERECPHPLIRGDQAQALQAAQEPKNPLDDPDPALVGQLKQEGRL